MTAASGNMPTYTAAQLNAMDKATLLSIARARGVDGLDGRSKKADIIAALEV